MSERIIPLSQQVDNPDSGLVRLTRVSRQDLLTNPGQLKEVEAEIKPLGQVLLLNKDNTVAIVGRDEFLPENGYLMHFNIARAANSPHIEPLPNAHDTISASRLCMVEGQKQYVLEMEAALVGVLENGQMRPKYIGTLVDFGDRTPRVDGTGRTYKTWTTKTWTEGVDWGGSTGMSATWVEVDSWDELEEVQLEYWVHDSDGTEMLHTPNAPADSLKLWGKRLGEWVGNYPPDKLRQLGIIEGKPFLLSTGQILYEDDGARSIDPRVIESFTAHGVMKFGEAGQVETVIEGKRMPRNEQTFTPTEAPLFYYKK